MAPGIAGVLLKHVAEMLLRVGLTALLQIHFGKTQLRRVGHAATQGDSPLQMVDGGRGVVGLQAKSLQIGPAWFGRVEPLGLCKTEVGFGNVEMGPQELSQARPRRGRMRMPPYIPACRLYSLCQRRISLRKRNWRWRRRRVPAPQAPAQPYPREGRAADQDKSQHPP